MDYKDYCQLSGSITQDRHMLNCFKVLEGSMQLKSINFYNEKLDKLVPKLSREFNKRKSAEDQDPGLLLAHPSSLPVPVESLNSGPMSVPAVPVLPAVPVPAGPMPVLAGPMPVPAGPIPAGPASARPMPVLPAESPNSGHNPSLSSASGQSVNTFQSVPLSGGLSHPSDTSTPRLPLSPGSPPKPLMSDSPVVFSEVPSGILTSFQQFVTTSWENSMKYVLVLLAGLSPIGLLYRLIPLNPSWNLNLSKWTDKLISYEDYKFVLLSYVSAFVLMYALNYRKMKDPKRIAVMFLQVMLIFPLILWLRLFGGEEGLDPATINPEPASQDSADNSETFVPLTPPSNTAVAGNTAENTGENTAWYYSKKFWVGITIVGLAAIAYYLKGSAPASPDDMALFHTAVSQGIDSVASSQASLHETLSERVNSAGQHFGQKS